MASVILDFIPMRGFTELHIYEAATRQAAPGPEIEVVTVDPDNPPTRYTTDQATSLIAWFSIQWEDAKGGKSPMSDPIQGGTFSIVSKVVNRVLLRDSSLDETIVTETAEWVVTKVMQVADPYAVDVADATMDQMEAMTLLTLARSHIQSVITLASSGESYTAGLVSQKSSSGSTQQNLRDLIKYLMAEANLLLGWNFSIVMLLEDIDPTGTGNISTIEYDHSRLLLDVE
jgi:hypothetical protein